jgi:hypothetical protein
MSAKRDVPPPGALLNDGLWLWRSIVSLYGLSPSELETLWQACQTADLIAALSDVLWSGGATVKGSAGQLKVSPLIPALSDQRRLMDSLLRSLNLPMPSDLEGRRRSPAAQAAAQQRWRQQKGDRLGNVAAK